MSATLFTIKSHLDLPEQKQGIPRDICSAQSPTGLRFSLRNSRFPSPCHFSAATHSKATLNHYRGRTAPLTSKSCILYIYSTNIGTEYFKRGINSPFFLQIAVCFIIITYLVPVLFTFYIFIQQIQVLNTLNMVYNLRFFLFKMQFVS